MQDLEAQRKHLRWQIVVKKHNMEGTSKEHENKDKDLEEFEDFKWYKAM